MPLFLRHLNIRDIEPSESGADGLNSSQAGHLPQLAVEGFVTLYFCAADKCGESISPAFTQV